MQHLIEHYWFPVVWSGLVVCYVLALGVYAGHRSSVG